MSFDYDAANKKIRGFKSRLTRLKNKGDHKGILALWNEFEAWCDGPDGMWPDNWHTFNIARRDAEFAIAREAW